MANVNRRSFIQKSAAGAVAAGTLIGTSKSWAGANDRINVACVGLNGRGGSHIDGMRRQENVEVAALCDIDEHVVDRRIKEVEEKTGKKPKRYIDMREIMEDPDIDVVTFATPNHWHALGTIWACQAGKDVYVEKPGTHNIWEGRKMIEAAHKYKRVVQHGVQLRSSAAIQEAVQHLRDGLIGDVYLARGLCYRWRGDIGHKPVEPVPDHIHYDLWLGPAQYEPFTRNIVHYNWHWMWEYGNGDLGNQGSHETDLCIWGLGVDGELPSEVTAMGGKFLWDDDKECPEQLTILAKYPERNKLIQFEVRPWITNDEAGARVGNIFYGKDGMLVVNGYSDYKTYLGRDMEPGPARNAGGDHFGNFIEVVRSRDMSKLNAPVETAHSASGLAHLGNISYRVGRTLHFDPKKETFPGDEEANQYLTRDYREPFVVPKNV